MRRIEVQRSRAAPGCVPDWKRASFAMAFSAAGVILLTLHHLKFSFALRRFVSAGLVVGMAFGFFQTVLAAPVNYLVDDWDTENNLPSSTVTSIAQTPDGYLWVGTYNGLARFDGARFVTFDPVNTPALGQPRVQGLFLDANGTLWINTFRGGLTSYRAGVFRNEWPDQPTYDLHTTLAASASNLVTFVTQFGEVLQRDPMDTNAAWQTFTPPGSPVFQCADAENRLWFLTRDARVLRFFNGEFKLLSDDGGLAGSTIYTLVADPRGQVWAGAENEIARWNGNVFEAMTPTNAGADIQPRSLFPLKSGAIWVLDGDRLRKMEGRAWTAEIPQWRGLLGFASGRAMGAHEDRAGGLWFNHYGNGLFHIAPDGKFQRLTTADNLPSDRVGAWFQSRDGGIWVGMDHGGLARLRDRRFHVISVSDGLPARTAQSVCEAAPGVMWIGTAGGGLCRWSNGVITTFAVGASASANFIFSIAPRPDGGAWLSAAEGEDLYQFSPARGIPQTGNAADGGSYSTGQGRIRRVSWDVHGIKSLLTDRRGRVWMGTKYGIAFSDGRVRRILGTNNVTTLPAVRALAETADGTVWAGADDGTIFRCAPDGLTPFRPDDALAEQPIYSLLADGNTLWAGTFRGGLLRIKPTVHGPQSKDQSPEPQANRRETLDFFRITAKQGLPVDVISQILDDGKRLWLGTHQGIYCVAKSELNAVADGRTNTLDYVIYGRHDGLASVECSDGYQPACWRASDGKLWFTTVRGGAVWVDPGEITARSSPPPVLIEELRVDGEPVALSPKSGGSGAAPLDFEPVVIPPGRKQLDIRYTALSFDAGDRTRFRYRVDGLDPDWVDLDTRRTVQLRNLPPRAYCFHVIACNSQGVWNDTGASLAFVVEPYFYQTLWFKILAGFLAAGGITFAARRAATRKYRRKLALLQQQHAVERDRARIAKDIHDDIGAGLTQITLLTELARREPEQTDANLDRITQSARKLTKAMDEIVWAVDPQHDTFEGLMDYISAYAEEFLRVAGVRCRMDLPVALPAMRVDAELRYNLFLALKEALNNVVKHAKATEVWLRLKIEAHSFTLSVEDNGCGLPEESKVPSPRSKAGNAQTLDVGLGTLDSPRLASGSGLTNLSNRLAAVGGACTVQSTPGRGTRVALTVRIKAGASPIMAIGDAATKD
jgi:signal transduction histidine kinase/ligand-binding sensor domain-containing protein